MIRMHMPDGTNQDPGAKFRRTTSEAFLCNADEANAFHHFTKKKRPGRWLSLIILGLVLIALFGCAQPQPQEAPPAIPDGVCAKGDEGIWIDASTIVCRKVLQ